MAAHNDRAKCTEIDDLTRMVIGCAMTVHRTLGTGFLESVYQEALKYELDQADIEYQADYPLKVTYKGHLVGEYKADLIVEARLVLELKAVRELAKAHEVQLVNYLAAAKIENGLLLNFGPESLHFKRKFRTWKNTKGAPDLQA